MMIIMELVSGLVILIPETLWRIRFCDKVAPCYKKPKGFTSLSEDESKKVPTSAMSYIFTLRPACNRISLLRLNLCPDFPFRRSGNWIKEENVSVTEAEGRRPIRVCTRVCAGHVSPNYHQKIQSLEGLRLH